ncbi:hypothetical protein [Myxococcus stipitatus]|uniref:hypothetical protein n=1 Tax=Myxococcus stipitatus TaxID=83455 RepID=UPI0030CB4B46
MASAHRRGRPSRETSPRGFAARLAFFQTLGAVSESLPFPDESTFPRASQPWRSIDRGDLTWFVTDGFSDPVGTESDDARRGHGKERGDVEAGARALMGMTWDDAPRGFDLPTGPVRLVAVSLLTGAEAVSIHDFSHRSKWVHADLARFQAGLERDVRANPFWRRRALARRRIAAAKRPA